LYFKNGYTGYQVHHPILKNYIVPDGIIHNFDQRPLNQLGKSIYLEKDQKIDMFVDFKSSFHSMAEKDWRIYTKLAKEFHIFLLNGRSKPYEADGCKIIFHSRNELISILREKITSTNKLKIQFLITNIKLIAQGKIEVVKSLINKTQKRIYDFS
ncbi:MAG: hypothetical protein HWN65_19680, partial [Candidatus Helarchaeota archaeon]|nr:hypothetical protein [Candidatus Helarchaeota archaeon]